MKQFLDKDFLLSTEMAQKLYHDYVWTMSYPGLSLPYQSPGNL